ncbi:MAG: YceI family protein [Chloroflexi bacterium]|nr:MAG: YceI family protein [Chloroflexota bacterium]
MSKRVVALLMIVSFFAGAGAGVLGYVWVIGGSGEASRDVSAPTLSVEEAAPNDADPVSNEPTEEAAPSDANAAEAVSDPVLYRIDSEESEVRFMLDEVLRGNPTTVVGHTNEIAGDIIIDFANPANSQLGQIVINVRTLITDNEFRNRALRSEILESNRSEYEYEFADFTPTELIGLPESVEVGQTYSFQIVGELRVRNITNTVTFDATVTLESRDRISGSATTTVTRADYNLTIPSVPGVANVSDEVVLEIDFVAEHVTAE